MQKNMGFRTVNVKKFSEQGSIHDLIRRSPLVSLLQQKYVRILLQGQEAFRLSQRINWCSKDFYYSLLVQNILIGTFTRSISLFV